MTFKYLLSNLQNFNPIQNYIEVSNREDLDKYIREIQKSIVKDIHFGDVFYIV